MVERMFVNYANAYKRGFFNNIDKCGSLDIKELLGTLNWVIAGLPERDIILYTTMSDSIVIMGQEFICYINYIFEHIADCTCMYNKYSKEKITENELRLIVNEYTLNILLLNEEKDVEYYLL